MIVTLSFIELLKVQLSNFMMSMQLTLTYHMYLLLPTKMINRYCECFASGTYCNGCNCINCHNNIVHEAARKEAVNAILDRNPDAFRPKIASSPIGSKDGKVCSLNSSFLYMDSQIKAPLSFFKIFKMGKFLLQYYLFSLSFMQVLSLSCT